MNHYLSTHLFVNHRLTTAMLSKIEAAGIPGVEIFCARQHLDYRNKAQIRATPTGCTMKSSPDLRRWAA